jgi:hypothetical protein
MTLPTLWYSIETAGEECGLAKYVNRGKHKVANKIVIVTKS